MSITCKGTSFFDLGSQNNMETDPRFSLFLLRTGIERHTYMDKSISDNLRLVTTNKRNVGLSFSHWGACKGKLPMQTFCTGSRYVGEWNFLGFAGEGTYRFPHGVIYQGEFSKQGKFQGLGALIYPNGQKIQGIWKNGKLMEGATYIFGCGEYLDEDFNYCSESDRRFHIELQLDFGPVGYEYLTSHQPTVKLPKGCYDAGNGIFDPSSGCILADHDLLHETSRRVDNSGQWFDQEKYEEIDQISHLSGESEVDEDEDEGDEEKVRSILEIPSPEKVKWIKRYCRKEWDEPTGYQPQLYKTWMAGRKHELYNEKRSDSNITIYAKMAMKDMKDKSYSEPCVNKFVSFIPRKFILPPRLRICSLRKHNDPKHSLETMFKKSLY